MSKLRYINSVNASGVSQVVLDDVFTDTFNAYILKIKTPTNSTAGQWANLRFVKNGGIAVTDYQYYSENMQRTTIYENYGTSQTSMPIAIYSSTTASGGGTYLITNSRIDNQYTAVIGQSGGGYTDVVGTDFYGYLKTKNTYTGICLVHNAGSNFTDVTLSVYGIGQDY